MKQEHIKSYYAINGLCLFIVCVILTSDLPLVRYNWCPGPGLTQIFFFVTKGAVSAHRECEMSQTVADDSEVVFEQPGKSAEAME